MINLNKINFISGDINTLGIGVSKTLDFLDLIGKNLIVFTKPKHHSNIVSYINKFNSYEFSTLSDIESLTSDSSVMFRVNLIVIDLWGESSEKVMYYKNQLEKLNIDVIILSENYHYLIGDKNVSVYKILSEKVIDENSNLNYFSLHKTKYFIKDQIKNTRYSFDDYLTSYKRDKKISDIFGQNEKK